MKKSDKFEKLNMSKFCKISRIFDFDEFRHFWTCSRNPEKIVSKFEWEIASFRKKSKFSIENSIFNLAKLAIIAEFAADF